MILILTVLMSGCGQNPNDRWARQLELQAHSQNEQARRLSDAQADVAEGARYLVEQDATARTDWVALQSQLESTRSEILRAQDDLESERREIARNRRLDPIIANAILQVGGLAACLVPLIVLVFVLRRCEIESHDGGLSDILIDDLARENPRLVYPAKSSPRLPDN